MIRHYYKKRYSRRTNIVGSPTIDANGLMSNFSTSNYGKLPHDFAPSSSDDWEFQIAFKLLTGQTGGQIFGTDNCYYHYDTKWGAFYRYAGIRPTITRNSLKVELLNEVTVYVNGSYPFPRSSAFYTADFSYDFDTTTTYVINVQKNGTTYSSVLTDLAGSFTRTNSATNSDHINSNNRLIGANSGSGVSSIYFDGCVDLLHSFIKLNGAEWWNNYIVVEIEKDEYDLNVNNPDYFYVDQPINPIRGFKTSDNKNYILTAKNNKIYTLMK